MKTCTLCNETKPLSEFVKKHTSPDGHSTRCKVCTRAEAKRRYECDVDYYVKKASVNKKSIASKNKVKIDEYLRAAGCCSCGINHADALFFHNLTEKRERRYIHHMVTMGYTWESIKAEIDNCVVKCYNCDAIGK